MAKLNGVTTSATGAESIIYGGKVYVRTTAPAQEGDIIRVDIPLADIDKGDYFEVMRVGLGDLFIRDNVGDCRPTFIDHPSFPRFTPASIQEPAKPTTPRLQVGDRVRLIAKSPRRGIGDVTVGEIGVVRQVNVDLNWRDIPANSGIRIDFPSQKRWNSYPDEVEKLSDAEVAEAEAQAKWAAIGRPVGDLRSGDLVRINDEASASVTGLPNGSLQEVKERDDVGCDAGVRLVAKNRHGGHAWMYGKDVELVTAVENRFDRQVAE